MTDKNEAKLLAEQLDTKHFTVWENGKVRLKTIRKSLETGEKILDDSDPSEIKKIYSNVWVNHEYLAADGHIKMTASKLGDYWLDYYPHKEYKELVFMPGLAAPEDCFNAWMGWNITEDPNAKWDLMQEHIYTNICNKDNDIHEYLLDWLAMCVQQPHKPAYCAVVMRGMEGAGKGIFASSFGEFFRPHFLHASKKDQVVGRFNDHLRFKIFIFADEAFFAGDKAAENSLKTLITEHDLTYEGKGKTIFGGKSCLHIMMATNHDWAVPVGPNSRRYFVIDVKDHQVSNGRKYFDPISKQMKSGGLEAMLSFLRCRQIKFDPYKPPRTKALLEQKVLGLHASDPPAAWLLDKLSNGYFFSGLEWSDNIPTEAAYNSHKNSCSSRYKASEDSFGKFLHKVFPDINKKRVVLSSYWKSTRGLLDNPETGGQLYHYSFGSLDKCRLEFEKYIGQPIDWDSIKITLDTKPTAKPSCFDEEPF